MQGPDHAIEEAPLTALPFPPITKLHVLNCSYPNWYSKYRTITLRSRIIPLTKQFLDYLRDDGLWLPDDAEHAYEETEWSTENANKPLDPDFEASAQPNDAGPWIDVHNQIRGMIKELGGSVVPKLNWSAPKDALHMALTKNSIACQSAQDIYLLLKSSIFVTHDLEHAFDDCVDAPGERELTQDDIPYALVLRPWFKINTSYEFRIFVRERTIVGISQRDLKHLDYGKEWIEKVHDVIDTFFEAKLKDTFEDENFAFDVYVPEPFDRVRLIDINPWAPRTDPLLFSWMELLTMQLPKQMGLPESGDVEVVRLPLRVNGQEGVAVEELVKEETEDEDEDDDVEELPYGAQFRVVRKDDPEAYNFGTAPYSAHKLPREVVAAGIEGGDAWKKVMEQWEKLGRGEKLDDDSSSDEEVEDFGEWDAKDRK